MTFDLNVISRAKDAWRYRNEPEELRELGTLFWRGLLFITLIVALLALWFGATELNAVSQVESVQTASSGPPSPLNPANLQKMLDTFTARQTQYQTLSQSPAQPVVDPSK